MRGFLAFFAMLFFWGSTGVAAEVASKPQVLNAWVRLPAIAGRPGAAYMEIKSAKADQLVSVSSPEAGSTMLHVSSMEGGIMRMDEVSGLALPAGRSVKLAPGGAHVMLYNLKAGLKAGQPVWLDLQFEKAGHMRVRAIARAATAP